MVEDIEIAEKIFGPDMYTLKVTTRIQSPKVVVDDFIEISRELIENNQELILCMYICPSINMSFSQQLTKEYSFMD